jgi:hypothetical protein
MTTSSFALAFAVIQCGVLIESGIERSGANA